MLSRAISPASFASRSGRTMRRSIISAERSRSIPTMRRRSTAALWRCRNPDAPEAAIADHERSLRLDPGNVEGWLNYGAALQMAGRCAEAVDAYGQVAGAGAEPCAGLRQSRPLAARDRATTRARSKITTAPSRLLPADPVLLRNKAVSLARLARHEEALDCFARAFALDPSYLDAADGALAALVALRLFEEAVSFCDTVLSVAPGHVPALLTKANALHETKRHVAALAIFDEALAHAPDDPQAAHQSRHDSVRARPARGGARLRARGDRGRRRLSRWRGAAAAWWRCAAPSSTRRSPLSTRRCASPIDEPDVHCGRGIVLKELGRFDEARAEFDRALAIDPRHAETKANKGSLLLLLGEFEEGLELFEHRWVLDDRPKAEVAYRWPEWRGEPDRRQVDPHSGRGRPRRRAAIHPLRADAGAGGREGRLSLPPLAAARDARPRRSGRDRRRAAEDAAYDYCVTLCSLPRAFGTRAETIPGRALSSRRAGARRAVARASFRRGIEGRHRLARQLAFALRPCARRAALAFAPLGAVAGVRLYQPAEEFRRRSIARRAACASSPRRRFRRRRRMLSSTRRRSSKISISS